MNLSDIKAILDHDANHIKLICKVMPWHDPTRLYYVCVGPRHGVAKFLT